MRKVLLGGAASVALLGGAPATAQIWIGQIVGNMMAAQAAAEKEHACMMGTPDTPSEVEETRAPIADVMARYASAVAQGGAADVRFAWHDEDGKARWRFGDTQLGPDKFNALADPFAAAGARMDSQPLSYLRSGDGSYVEGQWAARNASGAIVGVYDGVFSRKLGVWRLRSLTLNQASTAPAALVQYCHKPGDVEPYKVAWEERQRQIAAKRAAKAARKAAKEAERAAKEAGQQ